MLNKLAHLVLLFFGSAALLQAQHASVADTGKIDAATPAVQEQNFSIPFLRKLTFLPARLLEELCKKLKQHRDKHYELYLMLQHLKKEDERKVQRYEEKLQRNTSVSVSTPQSPSRDPGFLGNQRELVRHITRYEVPGHAGAFDEQRFDFAGEKMLAAVAKAVGPGTYATDLLSDLIVNSPLYILLQQQGKMPSPAIFKGCLRCLILVDPVLTNGWVFSCAKLLLELGALPNSPDTLKDTLAEYFNPDYINLDEPENFFTAQRADSVAAIPAIAELLALKVTASTVASLMINPKNGGFAGSGKRLLELLRTPQTAAGKLLGKFASTQISEKSMLANKFFWKDDLLTLAKCVRVFMHNVVAYRLLKMHDSDAFSKIYKGSFGFIEPRAVSFVLSACMLQAMSSYHHALKPIVNFKAHDKQLVADKLVRSEYVNCFFEDDGDSVRYTDRVKKPFTIRPISRFCGRFALQTLVERALAVLLDKAQCSAANLLDNTFEIKNTLLHLLKMKNPLLAKERLHQMFLKMTPEQQRQFEFNLAQHFGIPYKIVIGQHGLEIFVEELIDGNKVIHKVDDDQIFRFIAQAFNQPTMLIKSERVKIVSNLLAKFLTGAFAAPLVENALVGLIKGLRGNNSNIQGCFERQVHMPLTKHFWSTIFTGGLLATIWVAHGCVRNWISQGIALEKPEFDTALF